MHRAWLEWGGHESCYPRLCRTEEMAVHVEATSWCRSCSVVRAVKNEPLRIDTFDVRERTQGERLTSDWLSLRRENMGGQGRAPVERARPRRRRDSAKAAQ